MQVLSNRQHPSFGIKYKLSERSIKAFEEQVKKGDLLQDFEWNTKFAENLRKKYDEFANAIKKHNDKPKLHKGKTLKGTAELEFSLKNNSWAKQNFVDEITMQTTDKGKLTYHSIKFQTIKDGLAELHGKLINHRAGL